MHLKTKKKPTIRIIKYSNGEYNIVRKNILNIFYMYWKREINYTSFFYECISTRVTFPLAPEVLFSMPTWLPSGAASEKAIFPRQDLCTVSFPVDSLDLRSWKETNKNSLLTKTCVYVIRWWPVRFTCFLGQNSLNKVNMAIFSPDIRAFNEYKNRVKF